MSTLEPITVSVEVSCGAEQAWNAFTNVNAITAWNFASHDWHCPRASSELKPGGQFTYRMEAKDGSMGFDYEGTFAEVTPHRRLRFSLGPDREVLVEFVSKGASTEVRQSFTPESVFSVEQQRAGWQLIMDNYKNYVASTVG
jgi:uncharacterized protein YndB with AHSA1/START domain